MAASSITGTGRDRSRDLAWDTGGGERGTAENSQSTPEPNTNTNRAGTPAE